MLDDPGLLQEVVVEVSLQHEVVVVDLLQFPHQVLLPDDQFDHLLSYGFADFLDCALEEDLAVVCFEDFADVVENAFAGD